MAFEMHWEEYGLRIRYSGRLTYTDLRDATEEMVRNDRFSDALYAIGDYASVEEVVLETIEIEQVAALHWASTLSNPRMIVALVISNPQMAAAFKAYMQVGMVKSLIEVFPTLKQAQNWLRERGVRS